MSCRIILHHFFTAVLLLSVVDFEELAWQLGSKGTDRSRLTAGAPERDRTRTRKPDLDTTSYLRKFGYLPRSDQETLALRTMGEEEAAIRRFQRMAGIRVTGKVDEATIDAMRRKRCGMPDVVEALDFKVGPIRWEKKQLTYRILSYTSDVSQISVDDAIQKATRVWSEVTALTFRQIYGGEADLVISFPRLYHGDGYSFDGTGNVLAHAFPPGEGRGGDIHFDDDEAWSINSTEGVNLFIVAAHELGHSLGLLHSQDQRALMYPVYQGYQPRFRLGDDDIRGIQHIYDSEWAVKPSRPVRPTSSHRSAVTQRPQVTEPTPSDLCSSRFEAVARIRGEIFVFSGKWFWRLMKNDTKPVDHSIISSFWKGLPVDLDGIDAAFERPSDGIIFFFRGRRYWEFTSNTLSPGFPVSGRPIAGLGLPQSVDRVDAAFEWETNQRIYLVSGDVYWRLKTSGSQVETGYPLAMDMWQGVPLPIDAAFTHFDDRTYFLQGEEFWRLEEGQMVATAGSPKNTSSLWLPCSNEAAIPSVTLSPYLLCLFIYVLCIGLCRPSLTP